MRRRGTRTPRGLSARVAAGLVTGLLVTVGLAGCTDGPDEPSWTPTAWTPEETVEPSPTPTPTPTDPAAVEPERPAAMDTVDTAGAEAVAAYFLHLFAYSFATNDLEPWKGLSHPECLYCTNVTTAVEEQAAANLRSTGGLDTISVVTATEVDPGRWWAVDVDLVQAPSQTRNAAGEVTEDFPDTVSYHVVLAVVRESGRWLVREAPFTETARATS